MDVQMGNRLAALARYEKLKGLLQDEMGVEPSPELQSLYQDILDLKR